MFRLSTFVPEGVFGLFALAPTIRWKYWFPLAWLSARFIWSGVYIVFRPCDRSPPLSLLPAVHPEKSGTQGLGHVLQSCRASERARHTGMKRRKGQLACWVPESFPNKITLRKNQRPLRSCAGDRDNTCFLFRFRRSSSGPEFHCLASLMIPNI